MADERRIERMAGCSRLGKSLLGVAVAVLAVYFAFNLNQCFYSTDHGSFGLQVRQTIMDLKIAIECYAVDFNRFPIPESESRGPDDLSIRSRGPILPALNTGDAVPISPRKLKYIDLPQARNHTNGLWQDGEEWVLSDRWGESYYIVLDTNNDGKIANPDPAAAQKAPEILGVVLIFSSGPDRDPKTWQDNVCSWKAH